MKKQVLIVGGVAAGASAAARLRRLDEEAEITIFERGGHVSFANCGLPYYVGEVIPEEEDLLIASEALFLERFRITVKTLHDVIEIDREAEEISVRDLESGELRRYPYDALVLAPGAAPWEPPVPGLDLPGVFSMRTIPDANAVRTWVQERAAARAVVVGGGFIGLEMVENLHHLGLNVTLVERADQIMAPLDPEMAIELSLGAEAQGVKILTQTGLSGIEAHGESLRVLTDRGDALDAELVILALGVRPQVQLARDAGLEIGEFGGIKVDGQMRTSDPKILAVGDVIEVYHPVGKCHTLLPLAGPANRQGRIAAATIAGRDETFKGVYGSSIVGFMGRVAASTGLSEKWLRAQGRQDIHAIYLHPQSHAGYYPGAETMHLKLIFDDEGHVLGAQAVGNDGVDKRIDVIATAMQMGAKVHDLAEMELCYSPPFGSAKDPVNFAGMVAGHVLSGQMPILPYAELTREGLYILDVRSDDEVAEGMIPGAHHCELNALRGALDSLPKDRTIVTVCAQGRRGYLAQRILAQNGLEALNLSGGFQTYERWQQSQVRRRS